jgi:hypothetical protein
MEDGAVSTSCVLGGRKCTSSLAGAWGFYLVWHAFIFGHLSALHWIEGKTKIMMTILIVLVVLFLIGGGGWGYSRWRG